MDQRLEQNHPDNPSQEPEWLRVKDAALLKETLHDSFEDIYGPIPSLELLNKSSITDQNGKILCDIFWGIGGKIYAIHTAPFENTEATAEASNEYICETNADGDIIESNITRGLARKDGKRYLVVTTLLFHNDQVLLQERSPEKELDKGMLSASAHGVAKALYFSDGKRMTNTEYVGLINSALEINEELRHGKSTKPFTIKIWYNSIDTLKKLVRHQEINDVNTIYLVPSGLFLDDSYPLGKRSNMRTRMVSLGFIFSENKPFLSIDLAELASITWQKPSTFVDNARVTDDLQACIEAAADQVLWQAEKDGSLSKHLASKLLAKLFGDQKV